MPIKYVMNGKYLESVIINDQVFQADDENEITIPKSLLKDLKLSEIRKDVLIHVCESIQDGCVFLDTCPCQIEKIDNKSAKIFFDDNGRRKYWNGNIGFKKYMETKRDIIKEREKELNDIKFIDYDDDDDNIFLNYSSIIQDTCLNGIIQYDY